MQEDRIPQDIRKRIEEYDRNLDRWTFYEILYITRNADEKDVKQAYRKLVQLMHPDRHGLDLDPDYKAKLERIFNEINIAYNTLSSETERLKYDQSLIIAEDKGQPVKVDSEVQVAIAQYNRGIAALKKGEFTVAAEFFRSAIQLAPGKADYHAKLALALSKNPNPRIKKESLEACREAIKINGENANYHAIMGFLYQEMNDLENAEINYRRALSWDPLHHKAREELKNIALIKGQDSKENSLWAKISRFLRAAPKEKKKSPAPKSPPPRRTPRPKTDKSK